MKPNPADQLIVALDVETFEEARKLIDVLSDEVKIYKIGSQLFTACGPVIVRYVLAKGKNVFLDLKYHDIPNTVANAVSSAVGLSDLGHEALDEKKNKITPGRIILITLHTLGGVDMCKEAVQAASKKAESLKIKKPFLVGITVLTSEAPNENTSAIVLERAMIAKQAGLDGVVASTQEAELIRQKFGNNFIIVTPGIRPSDSAAGDQKRIATPSEAIKKGSNFLVVGRPIVKAANPQQAVKSILEEIKKA